MDKLKEIEINMKTHAHMEYLLSASSEQNRMEH